MKSLFFTYIDFSGHFT